MHRKIIILLLCLLGPVMAYAGVQSSARILTYPVSARALGMAEAHVALADDLYAIHYNPAGLNQLPNYQFGLTYLTGVEDTYYTNLSYAMPVGMDASLGATFSYLHGGKMAVTDLSGGETMVTASEDLVVGLSGGMRIYGKNMMGVNVKIIKSTLVEQYEAISYAFDGGILYNITNELRLGLVVKNVGPNIKYISAGDPLPTTAVGGLAYRFDIEREHEFVAALDIEKPLDLNVEPRLGLEYCFNQMFFGRAGFHQGFEQTNITFGAGLIWEFIKVDYAFRLLGDVSNNHHVTLTVEF